MTPKQIAAKLTAAQRAYVISECCEGSARGLVQRGLVRHIWGNDPAYGHVLTAQGKQVRAILIAQEQGK